MIMFLNIIFKRGSVQMIKINKIFNLILLFCYYIIVTIMLISNLFFLSLTILFNNGNIIGELLLVYPFAYAFIVNFIIYSLLYLF